MEHDGTERFQYHREKFKNLVHYICRSCKPDELGSVKLNKVLYFADMLNYVRTSQPMTGARYVRQNFGPTAHPLLPILGELINEGAIKVKDVNYYGFLKREYQSMRDPDQDLLSDDEKVLVADMIEFVCRQNTAMSISDFSHKAAWELARPGEHLPYFTVFSFYPVEVTDADVQWGREEAQQVVAA